MPLPLSKIKHYVKHYKNNFGFQNFCTEKLSKEFVFMNNTIFHFYSKQTGIEFFNVFLKSFENIFLCQKKYVFIITTNLMLYKTKRHKNGFYVSTYSSKVGK